ncbi:MAG: NADH-quinone oxidoreductase subunit H, partial [Chloroflexi bacterium]|nr:NADH-quinone oxidoreductase subunit H [Chloroflexota bacterium]
VIPFGRGMYAVDLNIGFLYIAAVSGGTTIPVLMAGWASRNKYALLGAMRAVAQLIAYEIPQVLSIVGVLLLAGSLSLVSITQGQRSLWYVVLQPVGFLIFLLSSMAELERKPFDIPEAESEIVAGYHIEYSGMKFAMFYLVIFFNPFLVSMIAVALFLGGWEGPLLPGYVWFLLKSTLVLFVIMWLSATVPRLRVDQLMGFAWKVLVPLSLVNLLLTGLIRALARDLKLPLIPDQLLLFLGANALMIVGTSLVHLLYAHRGRAQAPASVTAS